MTDRLAAGVVPELVGRADALRRVGRALRQAPALVLVEGEAGIGKTSLIRHALAGANATGVLVATCPAVAEPAPLGAVVAALRRSVRDVAGLGLSDLAGALRPLLPEWAASLPPAPEPLDDPSAVRHRIYRALTELVERLGVRILVLEDAHWADTATLEWLLTVRADAHGMSLVVSFRPWDVPGDSLLPRLTGRAAPGMSRVRVELAPLDGDQVREFVRSVYDRDEIDEGLVDLLREVTGGIPLVLEEYLLLLEDRGDILRADGRGIRHAVAELTVPAGVRESVLERIHRLDDDTQKVLAAVSILGDPVDESLVAAVAGLVPDRARAGVAIALARGLLREQSAGLFAFRHVIDAQAVSESLPIFERRRLHARAGWELRRRDHPPVARLAYHFGEAGDTERWATYAEASAQIAVESGDDHTAVEILLSVLDAPGISVEQRARLAKPLCQAAFFGIPGLGGLAHRVIEVLTPLLDSGRIPPAERGELRLHLGRVLARAGDWTSGFEQFEQAVDDLGERPDLAIRAMSNLGMPMVPDWPVHRHRYWLDRAEELLDRVSPPDRRAVRRLHAMALLLCGDADGWGIVGEVAPASSFRAEQFQFVNHRINLALAMLVWGRYGDAQAELDAARRHPEESADSGHHHSRRAREDLLDWYLGRWTGLLERAGEVATATDAASETGRCARQVRALLRLATGARSLAERSLRRIVDEIGRSGIVHPETVSASAALARLHLSDGDADAALAVTTPTVDLISTKGVWLWATDIAGVHVDALLATGREQEAADFVDGFAGGLHDRDVPAPAASLLTCRGILAAGSGTGAQQAVGLFEQAAAAWADLPRPYDELLTRERQGRALLALGQQESALSLLSTTQERMRDLGARWDADRVAKLVRGHGQAVARSWRGGRRGYGDRLSPRQVDVVRLVAQGLTNRQVAERLFLSTRTVEGHVTSAMRKLAAPSRTALVVAAVETGLIDTDHDTRTARE